MTAVAKPFLPFALPEIGDEEIAEVVDTLKSGWVTTGPKAKRFEAAFTEFLGDPSLESIAVNSATAGLHLALEALGIGPGDEVITTTHTFTATAEVVRYLGADVVLVDIDPNTMCIAPWAIEDAITPRTKCIVPVHYAGLAADMPAILEIARRRGLKVVEDAAHALPTLSGGQLVGTGDHRQPESLRGLAPGQGLARQDLAQDPAGHLDDGVRGWDHHADGLPLAERRDTGRDDPLIDQGPRRVMQQHLAVGAARRAVAEGGDGLARGVGARDPAGDDADHLPVGAQLGRGLVDELLADDHQHVVHAQSLVEGGHAVLYERPPREQPQLLGQVPAKPAAAAARQHHRNRPHERTVPGQRGAGRSPGPGATGWDQTRPGYVQRVISRSAVRSVIG